MELTWGNFMMSAKLLALISHFLFSNVPAADGTRREKPLLLCLTLALPIYNCSFGFVFAPNLGKSFNCRETNKERTGLFLDARAACHVPQKNIRAYLVSRCPFPRGSLYQVRREG